MKLIGLFNAGIAKLFATSTTQKLFRCAAVRHMARKVPYKEMPLKEIIDDFPMKREPGRFRPERPKTKAALLQKQKDIIKIKNTQKKVPIDIELVRDQTVIIKQILGVHDFEIEIWFCSDDQIRKQNQEWRGIKKATDVLSYQTNEFTYPGVFKDKELLQFHRHLGEMSISPAYVERRAAEDWEDYQDGETDEEDAGCSRHMSTLFTVQQRIPMLIIHGMLHMLGYDHETDEDWAIMTKKEELVIADFNRRCRENEEETLRIKKEDEDDKRF